MSNKQIHNPKTQPQGDQTVFVEQKTGGQGMFADRPASTIDGVVKAKNFHCMPDYVGEGRTGSYAFSETDLPYRPGYNGITAYKTGTTITATAGVSFTIALLGDYFVINGRHYQILQVTDTTHIEVNISDNIASHDDCWIHGQVWAWFFHNIQKKNIIHIDSRIFVADNMFTAWTEALNESLVGLSEDESIINHFGDDYAILANANGHFKIALDTNDYYYWNCNSSVPTDLLQGNEKTENLVYGRRRTYSLTKIKSSSYYDNRGTAGALIEQETGTCKINSDGKDCADQYAEFPIGDRSELYGVLYCATGNGVQTLTMEVANWKWLKNEATFGLELYKDGVSQGVQTINPDFSGVETVDDVMKAIQDAINAFWPTVTVKLKINVATGLPYIEFTTGFYAGYMLGYLTDTLIGYDLSTYHPGQHDTGLFGTIAEASLNNVDSYTRGQGTSQLRNKDRHHTHFSVWGSLDIGPNGTDPLTGVGNDPEAIAWIEDIPIMKALRSDKDGTGLCHATVGVFNRNEIGSWLRFENGNTGPILYLADALGNEIYSQTSSWCAVGNLTAVASQSATIGGVQAFTATQTGTALTIISGYPLTTADIGKGIFWGDGKITHVKDVLTANTATMLEYDTKTSQPACINYSSRMYFDAINDDIVRSRFGSWPLVQRFWEELPTGTKISKMFPGFYVVSESDGNIVYYSQSGYKYLVGYYNPAYQFDDRCKDHIKSIQDFNDKVVLYCANSVWTSAINQAIVYKLPNYGIEISQLPPFSQVDTIGIKHIRGITNYDVDQQFVFTNEPAVRIFDGNKFGETNLAEFKVMKYMKALASKVVITYNRLAGLIVWGSQEEE